MPNCPETTRRLTIREALAQAMRDLPPDDQSAEALIEAMRKYGLYVARVAQRYPSGIALIEDSDVDTPLSPPGTTHQR